MYARVAAVLAASTMALSGCGTPTWQAKHADAEVVTLLAAHGSASGSAGETGPASAHHRRAVLLTMARDELDEPYEWGADGPTVWDCSSFVRHAYDRIGVRMPRTARAQRDWMAAGNGVRIEPGQEQPGDVVFWDDYRGPDEIGHVAMVWDPAQSSTIEARPPVTGYYAYTGEADHSMFEIWRVEEFADPVAGS